MATNYSFLVLFLFFSISSLNTQARVMRETNYYNKVTADDKPLFAEENAAASFTTESSNGYGLFGNGPNDQEFQDFTSATTNEESNDQDIPAKYSTDVGSNQRGSYATKDIGDTKDEDELYKPDGNTKDSTKEEDELYKSDTDTVQRKEKEYESYADLMKRFGEMQQYRTEQDNFPEGHKP